MAQVPAFLSISLIDRDADYPGFAVSAQAEGFAGETEVWAARTDVLTFLSELERFDSTLKGEVKWVAGFEPQPNLVLSVRPFGRAGQLEISVDVLASASARSAHQVQLTFLIPEPNALTRFRTEFAALMTGNSSGEAVLTPAHREAGV